MGHLDKVIFKKKKFSSLLEEIYQNQQERSNQVLALISELKPLMNDIGDATLLVPLIKEYLDIAVKNDDQLIKLAGIIQRVLQTQGENEEFILSEAEKEQIFKEVNKINPPNKK